MSDEEEDYSSSDDSSTTEDYTATTTTTTTNGKNASGGGKVPGVLTLEDNEDDSSEFQRPDFNELEGEDELDDDLDDDEMIGEEETLDLDSILADKSAKGAKKKATTGVRKTNAKGQVSKPVNSQAIDDAKNKKKKKKRIIGICMTATKYECVRRVARKLGFKEVDETEDWSLFWTDTSVSIDRVNQMKKWQKINHYPGMSEICRKDFLTRNMNRMAKLYPKDYGFYPKAWCLPADYADFINYARLKKNKTYICKPDSGCQGRGIFLTKNPNKDIKPGDNYVVQVYVSRPFLVDGFKFDLRVYVAVTSCDPFRIFVYKEGLARFTTQSYEEPTQINCKDVFMHLTNYAIQKRSEEFIRDEETGTKRRISTINKWLRENGYDVDKMWSDIDDVIIKVLLSAHAVLKHNYRTCFANHYKGSACFEILGYDILVDKKLKPYVLEVNHSPSFTTDSKLDREIKDALIYDTIMLVNIGTQDKKKCIEEERKRVRERLFLKQGKKETKEELDDILQEWLKHIEKWEDKHMGNFRRIYPTPGCEKYDKFYNTTGTLFSETAASRARIEQAKQQMEEISRKNDKFIGLVNKNQQNRLAQQNKEVRGESPLRKVSTNQSITSSGVTKQSSISSANPSRIHKSQSQQLLNRNSGSNVGSAPYNNNNNSSQTNLDQLSNSKKPTIERPTSFNKLSNLLQQQPPSQPTTHFQQMGNFQQQTRHIQITLPLAMPINNAGSSTSSATAHGHVSTNGESWRPSEINEYEEMERVHSLKQRESLLKTMGIGDIVNRILSGTSGTVATLPPAFYNNNNNNNSNNNNAPQQGANLNQMAPNDVNDFTVNGLLAKNTSQISKLELRTKNFNPFIENNNHSLFAEKYINNQQSLRNNNMRTKTVYSNSNGTSNNASNGNLVKMRSKMNSQENNMPPNYRYQLSALTNGPTGANYNASNNDIDQPPIAESNAHNRSQSNTVESNKKYSTRYPIDVLTRGDSNPQNTTTLMNNFRIKSAQNVSKQRSSGFKNLSDSFYSNSLYIFSYHAPTRTLLPD